MDADDGGSRRLRVTVVVPALLGGAERTMLDLIDSPSARRRLDMRFILLGSGPLEDVLKERGHEYTVRRVTPRLSSILRATSALFFRWRRAAPDLVFADGVKAATVALPAARLAGIRSVWFKHDYSHDRWLASFLGRLADGLMAVSPEVAAATKRRDAVVIPPPRPTTSMPRDEALATLSLNGLRTSDDLVVATSGRLVSYKGNDDVLRALALPGGSSWRLAVIGDTDPTEPGERDRLEILARELGVSDRVSFLGQVNQAGRVLAAFDAVAVVSRRTEKGFGREGYSRVAAEAMFAGVPLIATPGGGILARLGGAGLVVPESAPEHIADALAELSDPSARAAMGAAGRNLVAKEPSADEASDIATRVLAETAGRPGAGLEREVPITVVTTVLDEGRAIEQLLRTLQSQLGDEDELVIVDGGSVDGTVEQIGAAAESDRRVRLIEAPGSGISRGRNEGIAKARHQVVACTDAGCEPWPGWLSAFRRAFAEKQPADLITGVYEVSKGNFFSRAMALSSYPQVEEARHPGPFVRLYGRVFGRTFEATMPTGRSLAFSVEAWTAVGGFPESLNAAEDVSFGRSIAATGRRCALSVDAGVEWRQRSSIRKTARMYFAYGRGGSRSSHVRVAARDLARALAYPIVVAAFVWGGLELRIAALVAAVAYISLPLVRAIRARENIVVIALLPLALAVKDLSKAAGYITGRLRPRPGSR